MGVAAARPRAVYSVHCVAGTQPRQGGTCVRMCAVCVSFRIGLAMGLSCRRGTRRPLLGMQVSVTPQECVRFLVRARMA